MFSWFCAHFCRGAKPLALPIFIDNTFEFSKIKWADNPLSDPFAYFQNGVRWILAEKNIKNIFKYVAMVIYIYIYYNLRLIIDINFYETFSTPLLIKVLGCTSLLIRLSDYQTQASSLPSLITFVNNFNFNSVVMFVCFVKLSSVINLIYSKKQLVLLYCIL